ncbi:hypothetical protein BJY04DRAFT_136764 [Aspergillus karnatakaensis]|uniref:uncharacterized protein n=1 Tax=Aspergillus karnatakaensis TaxID=1810916 RepID=UPI003CCE3E3C
MTTKDTLLSLDLGLKDCLYRTSRITKDTQRIIYVTPKNLDIISKESRTYGPDVIRTLSSLENWHDQWQTLTVYKDEKGNGIPHSEPDLFEPHSLREYMHRHMHMHDMNLLGDYELLNIFNLEILQTVKTRVFRVRRSKTERRCFLKIARFGFELGWFAREVRAYHTLTQAQAQAHTQGKAAVAPRLLGYVFEETPQRVIGILFEEVIRSRPGIADLKRCEDALRRLHGLGIVHGDVNRDNMFVTEGGVRFIDFEESCVESAESESGCCWEERKREEMRSLAGTLADESGRGRPLSLE